MCMYDNKQFFVLHVLKVSFEALTEKAYRIHHSA